LVNFSLKVASKKSYLNTSRKYSSVSPKIFFQLIIPLRNPYPNFFSAKVDLETSSHNTQKYSTKILSLFPLKIPKIPSKFPPRISNKKKKNRKKTWAPSPHLSPTPSSQTGLLRPNPAPPHLSPARLCWARPGRLGPPHPSATPRRSFLTLVAQTPTGGPHLSDPSSSTAAHWTLPPLSPPVRSVLFHRGPLVLAPSVHRRRCGPSHHYSCTASTPTAPINRSPRPSNSTCTSSSRAHSLHLYDRATPTVSSRHIAAHSPMKLRRRATLTVSPPLAQITGANLPHQVRRAALPLSRLFTSLEPGHR
jgi:hypothetical protein